MNLDVILGILLPFAGTTLGAAMVFFMRKEMNEKLQKGLLGFASGVMIAASVWSDRLHGFLQRQGFCLGLAFCFCWTR